MPWNSIPTRSTNDVLDETDMALYLENMEYLHTALADSYYETDEGSNFTTTATTWAALTSDYQLSLTTAGERVLVTASLVATNAQFDIEVDGTRLGSTPASTGEGSFGTATSGATLWVYPFATILDLSAGAHTFDLVWKSISGTATVYTTYKPWFMVRALKL